MKNANLVIKLHQILPFCQTNQDPKRDKDRTKEGAKDKTLYVNYLKGILTFLGHSVTKDETQDKKLNINILKRIDFYLWSSRDLR